MYVDSFPVTGLDRQTGTLEVGLQLEFAYVWYIYCTVMCTHPLDRGSRAHRHEARVVPASNINVRHEPRLRYLLSQPQPSLPHQTNPTLAVAPGFFRDVEQKANPKRTPVILPAILIHLRTTSILPNTSCAFK
jgi:hypothetical protein